MVWSAEFTFAIWYIICIYIYIYTWSFLKVYFFSPLVKSMVFYLRGVFPTSVDSDVHLLLWQHDGHFGWYCGLLPFAAEAHLSCGHSNPFNPFSILISEKYWKDWNVETKDINIYEMGIVHTPTLHKLFFSHSGFDQPPISVEQPKPSKCARGATCTSPPIKPTRWEHCSIRPIHHWNSLVSEPSHTWNLQASWNDVLRLQRPRLVN